MKKSILLLAILLLPFIETTPFNFLALKEQMEPIAKGEWVVAEPPALTIWQEPIPSFNESDLLAKIELILSWTKEKGKYLLAKAVGMVPDVLAEDVKNEKEEAKQHLKKTWEQFVDFFQTKISNSLAKKEHTWILVKNRSESLAKKSWEALETNLLERAEQTRVSLKETIQTLERIGENLTYFSKKLFIKIKDTLKEGIQTLKEAPKDLAYFAKKLFTKVEHTLKETLKDLIHFSKNLFPKSEPNVPPIQTLKEEEKDPVHFPQNLFDRIGSIGVYMKEASQNFLTKIGSMGLYVKEASQNLLSKIKHTFFSIKGSVQSFLEESWQQLKSNLLAKAENTWIYIREASQNLKESGKHFAFSIQSLATKIKDTFFSIQEGSQSFVKKSWEQLISNLSTKAEQTSTFIKKSAQTIKQAGAELVHFSQKGASDLLAKIESTLSLAKESATSFAKDSWKQLIHFFQKGISNLLEKIGSIRSSLKGSYKQLIDFSQKVKAPLLAKIGYIWLPVRDSLLQLVTGEWVPDITLPYLEKELIVQKVESRVEIAESLPEPIPPQIEAPIASMPTPEEPPRKPPQEIPPSFLPLINPVVYDPPPTYRTAPCEEPVLQFLPFIFESDVH